MAFKRSKNRVVYLMDFFHSTIQNINYQLKNVSAVHIATNQCLGSWVGIKPKCIQTIL